MDRKTKQDELFEIIELTINDLDSLSEAFELLAEIGDDLALLPQVECPIPSDAIIH